MTKTAIEAEAAKYAALETKINMGQVAPTLKLLLVEECTVPFITRYRKEMTGGLDEEDIRHIQKSYEDYIEREKRRTFILESMEKGEVLTPELKAQIKAAQSLNQLEDIYAPFKSKRKTKGQLAMAAGLEPLANEILTGKKSLEELQREGEKYLNPEAKFTTWEDCLKGAQSLLAERFSHDLEIKERLRKDYWKEATLCSHKREGAEEIKDGEKFKDYFDFSRPVQEFLSPKAAHRFLAMRRGMALKILKLEVLYPMEAARGVIQRKYFPVESSKTFDFMLKTAGKAVTTSLHPSLDLEIKSELKKLSDESAIDVFGINLKNLLLQPYLGARTVLALDPGVRTGCKTVVVDSTGKLLFDTVVYPHKPQNDIKGSQLILERLIDHYNVEYVAIGNGTFGRETLHFVEENVSQVKEDKVKATLVNESGASIYSASEMAKKEFPHKDATVRGAVSIARRFQDPLAELVKIDPKSIGVGQYQHDVNQSKLKKGLTGIVEDCVNFVGVDLNTASAPLLSYISGIGESVAKNIVKMREQWGGIRSRQQLLQVSRFSQKVFEQSAGFLRIYGGDHPLDATFIHPERYEILEHWAQEHGHELKDLVGNKEMIAKLEEDFSLRESIGEFTHRDIIKALKAPSQDPRTEFKSTHFRKDIKSMEDLHKDQWYPGIVTNITQFGAFVDIGIKQNGLVHISEMADRFVENALDILKVGQEVKAKVIAIDKERGRIALSLKKGESPPQKKGEKTKKDTLAPKGPRKSNSSPRGQTQRPQELKNTAFSALKNFKIKK